MEHTIILRFRDLITEDDGTIDDHLNLISNYGEVWWGWWMKQTETAPREVFVALRKKLETQSTIYIYLYNTGLSKIYRAGTTKILVAPSNNRIRTPDAERSPAYYHRGAYPAWFLFNEINEVAFEDLKVKLIDLPTRPEVELSDDDDLIGKEIAKLEQLRKKDVTLWQVDVEDVSRNFN